MLIWITLKFIYCTGVLSVGWQDGHLPCKNLLYKVYGGDLVWPEVTLEGFVMPISTCWLRLTGLCRNLVPLWQCNCTWLCSGVLSGPAQESSDCRQYADHHSTARVVDSAYRGAWLNTIKYSSYVYFSSVIVVGLRALNFSILQLMH